MASTYAPSVSSAQVSSAPSCKEQPPISNQDLWKILSGLSSLGEPAVREELCAENTIERLKKGLSYYKPPSKESVDELKGSYRDFVLLLSERLTLDKLQCSELFRTYFQTYQNGELLANLEQKLVEELKLAKDGKRAKLVEEMCRCYYNERLDLLRCVHHLLGYWQDQEHPYQETYRKCLDLINQETMIDWVWNQYKECAKGNMPPPLKGECEESVWVMQNLKEQRLLLEIALLYYKDYNLHPSKLKHTVETMQKLEFGSRQSSRLSLTPSTQSHITHLNHLSALLLVEVVDLEFVQYFMSKPSQLQKHHLLADSAAKSAVKEIDQLLCGREWGDNQCHAPFLLAWMLFKYITRDEAADLEQFQSLGNVALQCGVFQYLLSIVESPPFTWSTPLPSVVKVLVHTLLSVTIRCFSETSLGDPHTLVAIATKTLTHPRLLLEFWEEEEPSSGAGVLLPTAMANFPLETPFSLLTALSSHPHTAHSVTGYLISLHTLTLELSPECVVYGDKEEERVLSQSMEVFVEEARQMGVAPLCLPAGTKGTVASHGSEIIVCWSMDFSALDVFSFLTCSLLSTPGVGIDSTPDPLVATVTMIAKLVTQILDNDWSLFQHFCPITCQYFLILQKYSPLPRPPIELLAACVKCLAIIVKNCYSQVWDKLSRTGFLPYISGPVTTLDRIPVARGHFGNILNTWERARGVYVVTMAMLDFLIGLHEGSGVREAGSELACVVWVCEEVIATCQKWRYRIKNGKEELAHKLLLFCHTVLKSRSERVRAYVRHFLLHTNGHEALISALSLGVDVVNRLLSNWQGPPPVQVESLKLAFQIISDLLQSKLPGQDPTALEHALTTQLVKQATPTEGQTTPRRVHLMSLIASYIHHHGDPLVPIGATKLLSQLSLVSPMSVYACLRERATSIRDAFVGRLESRVEHVELKVAILELVRGCVQCQPGMAELFLNVTHSNDSKDEYKLEESSCLNAVLSIVKCHDKTLPSALTEAAASLLASLWEGRHDAALFALRNHGTKDFWKDLTTPLFSDKDKGKNTSLLVVAKVMNIVTMETYYTVKSQLDKELLAVVKEMGGVAKKKDSTFKSWIAVLGSDRPEVLSLTEALSSLLLVLCSSPDTKNVFEDSSLKNSILDQLLNVLDTRLIMPNPNIPIATELSMLYLVLFRKWSHNVSVDHCNKALSMVSHVLLSMPSELATPLYSIALLALQTARDKLEPRFSAALIPCIASTLQNYSSPGSKFRADVMAVYALNEIVRFSSPDSWLRPLQHHAIVMMLVRRVDHFLSQLSDYEYVEATLVLCLGLTQNKEGAESLLLNGISQTLCISLTNLVSAESKEWKGVWLLVLRLVTHLLLCLGHQFLSDALDFVGVHQERLAAALDLFQAVKDLYSLQETVGVCRFFLTLSRFRTRWQFILPNLVASLLEHLVALATGAVTVLNKRVIMKHIIKTMHAGGLLSPDVGPVTMTSRRKSVGRSVSLDPGQLDDSLVTSCPAFVQLQDGLVSILMSSLYALRHFSPPLDTMILDGVLDLAEYPSLFTLSLDPPIDNVTPPPLGMLTTCLSTVLALFNKMDPGSPTKALSRSQSSLEKEAGLVCLLEQAVFLLLSQATRFLVDPSLDDHDKQLLKKALGNELNTFLKSLLLTLLRKRIPSPGSRVATPSRSHSHLMDSASSGKYSSLVFGEEQGMFRLADSFVKQFLR